MQNILFVQTAFLGDLLLSIPTLKNCKRLFPNSKIHLICRAGIGDFFTEQKIVDHVYEVQKNNSATYKNVRNKLKDISFDLLLSPHESFRTMLLVKSIRAKLKVSYKKWYQFYAYDKCVNRPLKYPEALRQIFLLTEVSDDIRKKFSELNTNTDWRIPSDVKIPDWATASLFEGSSKSSKKVCLAPGSVWATKMWPKEYYADLASSLIKNGHEVVLVGGKSERVVCDWIKNEVPQIQNKAGETSLSELLKVFSEAALLISNDSGPMHMASLVGLPTIAIFGPTVLSFGYRPWQNNVTIKQIELPCRPCGKHGHNACPIGTHDCMKLIEAEMVKKNIMELLG
ncbi:MAG: glycosyltransferase family 9 protein [Bdellovibrionales bacterium]|nr:glycosyltransferase family 9 protein [Bdellovibrionales bacterium]